MYRIRTKVTNLVKYPRQISWLGIPADRFAPNETRIVEGAYPDKCMSRVSQFDYEIANGLVKVELITDMPIGKDSGPTAPAPKAPVPAAKPVKVAEPPKKTAPAVETPQRQAPPAVHADSGIVIHPPPNPEKESPFSRKSLMDEAENGPPPAVDLFPNAEDSIEGPLSNIPTRTVVFGEPGVQEDKAVEQVPAEAPSLESAPKTKAKKARRKSVK